MKKPILFISLIYIFFAIIGSVYGIEEKSLLLGGNATWESAQFKTGVTEVSVLRPHPVLVLCSAADTTGPNADLHLSFNEKSTSFFRDNTGRYRITSLPEFQVTGTQFARSGHGAALFGGVSAWAEERNLDNISLFTNTAAGSTPLVIEPQSRNALFAPGNHIRDFTIEFWLFPFNLENGERILSWTSLKPAGVSAATASSVQRILCTASRNRLHWSFDNFFSSPGNSSYMKIEFSGITPIVPRTWSHHLVRFDAATGLVEYLVNGKSEAIVYATSTRRENSEVFTPVAGNNGAFLVGEHFTGMIDEIKIHSAFAGRYTFDRYSPAGGRAETRPIDLGSNSHTVRVDASGGRANWFPVINNEFRQNGRFRFPDNSEMNFFIRASDNPWLLNETRWVNFIPGTEITENIRGRYVQLAVDFYPSADGYTTPYLSELRIVYRPAEPPLPPRNVTAIAVDGGVQLSWRPSISGNTSGYRVYYSSVRGELFGTDSALGPSPIDVGNRNNILIDGLRNGTLYYFRVAAYDNTTGIAGEFSMEVTARPLASNR